MRLSEYIPNHADLLAMEAEEIAGVLIQFLHTQDSARRGHGVHANNALSETELSAYPQGVRGPCQLVFGEAWSVLEREGILALKPDQNHGWYFITRKGQTVRTRADFSSYRLARMFPRESIHPTLLADAYPMFLRGQYEAAIFQAFKLIEVEVRDACPGLRDKLGTDLMNHAFRPADGPLRNPSEPTSEQLALMNLFSGAIGRFKNPASHRRVPDLTATDAIEAIQFASHLLRVVEERRPGAPP